MIDDLIEQYPSTDSEENRSSDAEADVLKPNKMEVQDSEKTNMPSFMDLKISPEDLAFDSEPARLQQYFNWCLETTASLPDFSIDQYKFITLNAIDALKQFKNIYIEEPVDFAYYIGEINGDFLQLLHLIRYFQALLTNFPTAKIVFLGNYIGRNSQDLDTLMLLYLFYLQYPDNVVILRGSLETLENAQLANFWQRVLDQFHDNEKMREETVVLQRYIAYSFSQLPLFHIAIMSEGQIQVYGSSSGIPFFLDQPDVPFNFRENNNLFTNKTEMWKEFDIYSQQILSGFPVEDLPAEIGNIDLSDPLHPHFGKGLFKAFLAANQIHYMVRSASEITEGYEFSFNSFICSIFSTSQYELPKCAYFESKILRLAPGTPPNIIGTLLEELQV